LAGKKPLYGPEFSAVVQKSLISLNVTDTTNFPAPNMRFFEILASGGTELVSGSDEMKSIFVDGEDLLYFSNNSELLEQVALLTARPELSFQIRRQGYAKIVARHLYTHRLTELLGNV
jgi:spore maturation protein CgeB